jgi:hypothetical protein
MTITISFANTSDGRIESRNSSYSSALAGSSLIADTTSPILGSWGQRVDSGIYEIYEYFVSFPYTLVATDLITAAYFEFYVHDNHSASPSRSMEVREYDWSTTVTTADWRTPSQLNALTLLGRVEQSEDAPVGQRMRCGSEELGTRLETTGEVRVVCVSSRARAQSIPSDDEEVTQFSTANFADSPRLVFTSTPMSTLTRVVGAQIHLSDGTHCFLESSGAATAVVLLKHRNAAGTVTTLGTISSAFGEGPGMQNFALIRDASDNLFVFSRLVGTLNDLKGQAFVKAAGHNWNAANALTATMPSYVSGEINNVAAAWHSTGTAGTIVVFVSHAAAYNSGTPTAVALLSPSALLAGSGSMVRAMGSASGLLHYSPANNGFNSYVNETGTLLDMAAVPGTTDRGIVVTAARNLLIDGVGSPSVARYILHATGADLSNVAVSLGGGLSGTQIKKDATSKLRVIALTASTFVVAIADPSSATGLTVCVVQNSGTSSSFNNLSRARIGDEVISTMSTPAVIASSSAWDIVWDAANNWVWVYYLDTANSRRLMKTHVDLNTGLPAVDQVQVATNIGAVGSTNLALRVHRGAMVGDKILVTLGNRSSGGALTTEYILDSFNSAPFAPTLTPKSNFNATNAAIFQWTFNDPNPGDTQSAFQLLIINSSGVTVHDTGKVVSTVSQRSVAGGTLTNGQSYTWRVRTYDALDVVGPYSTDGSFVTSVSGTLDIITPATDNPAGVITKDNLVAWTVTGATQTQYRVVVRVNATNALLVDTGWVVSTATQYLIQNMLSGIEYRIEVTARNATLVETNTDDRLLTADYDDPETPVVTLTTEHELGFIRVGVENPTPQGDRPAPVRNDVYRSVDGETFTLVGSALPNGEFHDYSVADGIPYQYFARAMPDE